MFKRFYVSVSNQIYSVMNRFKRDDHGASVIEWLIMAAIAIGLGVILYTALKPVVNSWVNNTNTKMTDFLNGN